MIEFKRSLALSGVFFATALGALGIGEYANDLHTDNLKNCYIELDGQEAEACKEDVGPDPDTAYGILVIGLGGAGILMGAKAYIAHAAQTRRDEEYRQAEGLI